MFLIDLQPVVGPGPAIVITGVARLWQTALELLMAGIGWMGLKYGTPGSHDSTNPAPACEYTGEEAPRAAAARATGVLPASPEIP